MPPWSRISYSLGVKSSSSDSRIDKGTTKRNARRLISVRSRPLRRSIRQEASLTTTTAISRVAPGFRARRKPGALQKLGRTGRRDQLLSQGPPNQTLKTLQSFEGTEAIVVAERLRLLPSPGSRIGTKGIRNSGLRQDADLSRVAST